MTTPTLSRVTLETMANYRVAATQMVAAYGAGSRRLVKAVDGALQHRVLQQTVARVPAAVDRFDAARDATSRIALQGIEQAVTRTEQVISRGSEFAVTQVERLADATTAIDNRYVVQGLQTAARLTLPAAQLALALSGKVAEGATQLADVAGASPLQATVRRGAKTTRRAVAKAQVKTQVKLQTTARRSRKAMAKVVASAPAQRVRRAANKAKA